MTAGDGDLGGTVVAVLAFVVIAVLVLGLGVWFGMVAIAPRIIRPQDRAEEDPEAARDRHD